MLQTYRKTKTDCIHVDSFSGIAWNWKQETKTQTKSEEIKSPEVEVEKPEEKKQEESGDELEQYSEGVQKRINKLTARLRESERREKATMDYAKGVQKELKEIQTQSKTIDGNFVQEFKNRVSKTFHWSK